MLGQTVGSYTVTDKLGEGGMGAVYRGKHPQIGREVAIKVLLPDYANNANVVQRFFNEGKAATAIKHPGIVEIYDVGYHVGSPYIIMEFLRGEPLQKLLERQTKLPPPDAIRVMRQIASALGAAHAGGIVHRDLKPDNVFMVPDKHAEGGVQPKLLDFGIAKLDEDLRGDLDPTRAGAILGTPQYMSPEQCTGSTNVDHRADIYALGCLLFHMVTGRPPFVEQEFGRMAIKHLSEMPPRPSVLEPAVSIELEKVIMKMLAKTPDERYQSCGQLVDALEGKTPRAATPVPPPTALPPGARTYVPGELMVDPNALPPPKKSRQATPAPAAVPTPAGPAPSQPVQAAPSGPMHAAPSGPMHAAPSGPMHAAPSGPMPQAPSGPIPQAQARGSGIHPGLLIAIAGIVIGAIIVVVVLAT